MKHYLSLDPLLLWMQEDRPIRWSEKFGRAAEVHVEIGFGLGDYLVRAAGDQPGMGFVGIETTWLLVRRVLRKIALAGIRNVRVLQMDAWVAFERTFEEKSVHGITSLFPCPWPKRRHVKNRLFSRDFLRLLNSRLVDGGRVLVVTDHEGYLDWVLTESEGTGFSAQTRVIRPSYRTKYEKKWQSLGREAFYEACLAKEEHISFRKMEERTLRILYVNHFEPEGFSPEGESGEIAVEFKGVLYDAGRKMGMVRSVVSEGTLLQDFWIEIADVGNRWRIRPARGCSLIPTAGAQRALDLIHKHIERAQEP